MKDREKLKDLGKGLGLISESRNGRAREVVHHTKDNHNILHSRTIHQDRIDGKWISRRTTIERGIKKPRHQALVKS